MYKKLVFKLHVFRSLMSIGTYNMCLSHIWQSPLQDDILYFITIYTIIIMQGSDVPSRYETWDIYWNVYETYKGNIIHVCYIAKYIGYVHKYWVCQWRFLVDIISVFIFNALCCFLYSFVLAVLMTGVSSTSLLLDEELLRCWYCVAVSWLE